MTDAFQKEIQKLGLMAAPDAQLDFVKFCTVGSIDGRYPKIIFFAFEKGKSQPSLVVKTVRSAGFNFIIEKGHGNASKLFELAEASGHAGLFSKPLYMGASDGIAYSFEEAVQGRRSTAGDTDAILSAYIGFQSAIAAQRPDLCRKASAHEHIRSFVTDAGLLEHSLQLFKPDDELALMPQHGDLTFDNAFMAGGGPRLIDCDNLTGIELAGFDIFHLLIRSGRPSPARGLDLYFKAIGQRGWNKSLLWLYFLHELYSKDSPLLAKDAAEVRAAFEEQAAGWDNGRPATTNP